MRTLIGHAEPIVPSGVVRSGGVVEKLIKMRLAANSKNISLKLRKSIKIMKMKTKKRNLIFVNVAANLDTLQISARTIQI